MNYYKISVILSSLILLSCSTQHIVQQDYTETGETTTATRSTQILYSESTTDKNTRLHKVNLSTSKPITNTTPKPETNDKPVALTPPAPKITFTSVESANIRVPGNNPLPLSGGLTLDLSNLQHEFCYPYSGKVISNYGMRGRSMHTGVDLKAIPNDTVRAALSGVVRMSKTYSGYGNVIVIRHGCGIETVYAHQAKNIVHPNDVVKAGQAIGLAGRTGKATTEHVHFELRVASEHIDPSKFLDYDKMELRDGFLTIKNQGGKLLAYNSSSGNATIPMVDLVPSTATNNSGTATASTVKTTTKSIPTKSSASYHTVKKGDTLSEIARTYSTTVSAICSLNKISKDSILSLGQKLKLN